MTRLTRRELLRAGAAGCVGAGLPGLWRQSALAMSDPGRVLVVVELSGGNDGLNSVVPWSNDAYRRARPAIGLEPQAVLKLDDEFGLHPRLLGLRELWEQQRVAIVHGCGYPDPIRSHFSAMAYWHTGVPHGGEPLGWLGRGADARWPAGPTNTIVNIAQRETLAVRSERHAPIVFSDPKQFARAGSPGSAGVYRRMTRRAEDPQASPNLAFLRDIARTADRSSGIVRDAIASYDSPVSYGSPAASLSQDLRKVAALMSADFPARIYYVAMGGFDTHGSQLPTQQNLLMYLGDALQGFFTDLDRMQRSDEVALLVFTEFGRRVAENRSGGTDHGTATPLWVLGAKVKPGFHGQAPSLTELDDGDLVMTTDFRRVYASLLSEWMGVDDTNALLRGDFEPLDLLEVG